MGQTIIEKILSAHTEGEVRAGEVVDLRIDTRVARDFGGANVVGNLRRARLPIADAAHTFFTFDCNPTGSDQRYATNQQLCRQFAREQGIGVYDINAGIGTHVALEQGLVVPGATAVSTDSHANILGAIGAFGQGMGDVDIAHAFAYGRVWFKVPPTVRVVMVGTPGPQATAKDLTLALVGELGASGLLGCAAEMSGAVIERLDLAGRITMASMATEMGGIIALFEPNDEVLDFCRQASGAEVAAVRPDADADYQRRVEVNVQGLEPLLSRPGHPDHVAEVAAHAGTPIDSGFIGSCTNGRYEDLAAVAELLRGRRVAPGVVLKIVPATDGVWRRCLDSGLMAVFKEAGALVGNAGCGGCAAGQIGQNGPGEVTVSSGNRNFTGKQGKGEVYLASPVVVAASAVVGAIARPDQIDGAPAARSRPAPAAAKASLAEQAPSAETSTRAPRPTRIAGRVWVIDRDNIDTDMIFHNRHLAITEVGEMGRHAFGNLEGYHHFAAQAREGDIIVTGANFGAGSSRQQAVDCFKSLGVALIIARSFGAIYERNAINSGFATMTAPLLDADLSDGQQLEVDLEAGAIRRDGVELARGAAWSPVQLQIYQRGGLLAR